MLDARLARGDGLPFFLQRRVHFREATSEDVDASTIGISYKEGVGVQKGNRKGSKVVVDSNGFQEPAQELFPRERVKEMLQWERITHIGPGLTNLGNTCFLNSVLQCLTYTPPLANYLLRREHGRKCRMEGFCLVCELERHVNLALGGTAERSHAISPTGCVAHLKLIAKHMRVGRQEDSHEFLRFVVEGMQRSLLMGLEKKDKLEGRLKETTLVHQIFGGYLQSRVTCQGCQHVSSTFDPFLDLSLEIRQADSIERALRQFTQPERLTCGNRYRCEHCGRLCDASKTMSIYRPPNVLTIHLKRFQISPFGQPNKIGRQIDFAPSILLDDFVAERRSGVSHVYDLCGVLVHEGQTTNSGHYHCFVKGSNALWYSMNDSCVQQVSLSTVLKQRAYLLFYIRRPDQSADRGLPILSVDQSKRPPNTSSTLTPPPTPPAIATKGTVEERRGEEPPTMVATNSLWKLANPENWSNKTRPTTPVSTSWQISLLRKRPWQANK